MPEEPQPKARQHPWRQVPGVVTAAPRGPWADSINYVDLHVTSNFTFLAGASHPDELVQRAAALGHAAAAVTDCNSLAGVVRAHVAAREIGIPLAVGCRLELERVPEYAGVGVTRGAGSSQRSEPSHPGALEPCSVLVFPTDRAAYGRLCRLLTIGKRRAKKGTCRLALADLLGLQEGLLAVVVPGAEIGPGLDELLATLRGPFDDDRLSLALAREYGPEDEERLALIARAGAGAGVPLVVTNDVRMHVPERKPLHDVLTCIRHGCTLEEAGVRLLPNAEKHLKPPAEMARLFAGYSRALARTAEIAERAAAFNLGQLRYEYPDEVVPAGRTPMEHLRELVYAGAEERYRGRAGAETGKGRGGRGESREHDRGEHTGGRVAPSLPDKVRAQVEHELAIIAELDYAAYFLTVHDLVVRARELGILCQGRGAAANSAVCYCLGITAVDPDRIDVLFERFVSRERSEPPDIDIDFEHERREEIIQYIYAKYGRERAALTAEVISYRGRSAIREVGKALGLSLDCVDKLARSLDWWDGKVRAARLRELGLAPGDPTLSLAIALATEILGFPRHLSQHVGGFVMTRGPLCESVPIENAAMPDRTVIEWDKDDIEALGMLKVDVLGLGMLTVIGRCFKLVEGRHGGTESRRHEGREPDALVMGAENGEEEVRHGRHQDIPRSDRLAAFHATGTGGVSVDQDPAGLREVRAGPADAPGGGLRPLEYRGGVRAAEPEGVREVPSNRARFAGGALHTVGNRGRAWDGPGGPGDSAPALRGGPDPAGADPQSHPATRCVSSPPRCEGFFLASPEHSQKGTPCLRASVPPCLPRPLALHTIPPEDQAVYDMICRADTVGVFQIESRAQMSMLPRLRPREFYDLVIEVAIVRPGPIQGNMVHPYLKRRRGEEPETYPDEKIRAVLKKTLGVPLFQEQAMSLAIVAAGFTPGQADQLRRAIASWKTKGNGIYEYGLKIVEGMVARGYTREYAQTCFEQIQGFSGYGFPESHAASFALLVYVSAWLKCHHPAAFAAALLNSQPMGFYAPAQLVRDAREHGVEVRGVDVNHSGWDCSLEEVSRCQVSRCRVSGCQVSGCQVTGCFGDEVPSPTPSIPGRPDTVAPPSHPALRLGLRLVRSLRREEAEKIERAVRAHGPFRSVAALWRASGVKVSTLRALARADALGSMGLDRQRALWEVRALRDEELPIFEMGCASGPGEASAPAQGDGAGPGPALPRIEPALKVIQDYATLGLSLKAHPVAFLREFLMGRGVVENQTLRDERATPAGERVTVAGLVLVRQRPGTASGIVFMTIEDETGVANLIVRPRVFQRFRREARHGIVVIATGRLERHSDVVHVVVSRLEDVGDRLSGLVSGSRDFH